MYKLCVFISRRALELAEGAARLVEAPSDIKVTTLAMLEVAAGKVTMSAETKEA